MPFAEAKRYLCLSATIVVLLVACQAHAQPQTWCAEGRSRDGACVNPLLALVQRKQAIIGAQPRLSMQTPLNLAGEDGFYTATTRLSEPSTYIANTRNELFVSGTRSRVSAVFQTPRYVPARR